MNEQFRHVLSRVTDPKSKKPNKITRYRNTKLVVIRDSPVYYPDGAMVKIIGLKGRPSTTYALGKYIPHFRSVFGLSTGTKPGL